MDQYGISGVDLGDASDVDRAFGALQDRLKRAEGLLARALASDMTAASSGATGAVDMTTAAASAAAIRGMSPQQKNNWVQSRAREVGSERTRAEMAAMVHASAEEYQGILARSGLRYGNRR